MASAAMADATGSKVFLSFRAGWYNGSTTVNNGTAYFGPHATPGASPSNPSAASYNIGIWDGTSGYTTYKAAADAEGYTFTLVVAPGTGTAVSDHIGDAGGHANMVYISAWNIDAWTGATGYTIPNNWQVTVSGARVQGGSQTWTKGSGTDGLWRSAAPGTTAVGNVGFWFQYDNNGGAHYTDWASAVADGNTFTVTLAPIPPTPEPGSLLALGSGLMGLVGFAVRRRRA
jgi:hypothetical protein